MTTPTATAAKLAHLTAMIFAAGSTIEVARAAREVTDAERDADAERGRRFLDAVSSYLDSQR